eukprot:96336-Lingulodinium_polyedra.AAC.1
MPPCKRLVGRAKGARWPAPSSCLVTLLVAVVLLLPRLVPTGPRHSHLPAPSTLRPEPGARGVLSQPQ